MVRPTTRCVLLLVASIMFVSVCGAAASRPVATKHDRDVIRFFNHHRALVAKPKGAHAFWLAFHHVVSDSRSMQDAKVAVPTIAHLALWKCIAGYRGSRPGGGPGESWGDPRATNGNHFNILQMTRPWGQGAYYVADPTTLSATEIMVKAERGYVENHYSHAWLNGQWGQTVGPCWGYA